VESYSQMPGKRILAFLALVSALASGDCSPAVCALFQWLHPPPPVLEILDPPLSFNYTVTSSVVRPAERLQRLDVHGATGARFVN
jgi:hypothetical protein